MIPLVDGMAGDCSDDKFAVYFEEVQLMAHKKKTVENLEKE